MENEAVNVKVVNIGKSRSGVLYGICRVSKSVLDYCSRMNIIDVRLNQSITFNISILRDTSGVLLNLPLEEVEELRNSKCIVRIKGLYKSGNRKKLRASSAQLVGDI